MTSPDELLIEDVRCFRGEHRARLRPITLLVGENSTGKTTLLGCYGALHRTLEAQLAGHSLDFNREPFSMGSFRDIVRSRRGREGRIQKFRLGLRVPGRKNGPPPFELAATLVERGSQPVIESWRYAFPSGEYLELRYGENGKITLAIEGHEAVLDGPFELWNLPFLVSYIVSDEESRREPRFAGLEPIAAFLRKLSPDRAGRRSRLHRLLTPALPPLVPVAPLRAKPHRTYDPIRETATPEGTHIPMLMMRLDHEASDRWKSLREDLVEFGEKSGLFSDIRVKRHGRQISDPFQLQLKVHSGSHANIVDVGYGVSQSLPILVELLTPELGSARSSGRRRYPEKGNSSLFLLQQPEVHLHPRGQAEFASFLVNSVTKRGNRFLIETHSDHIVDRIRISVRKQQLEADQVSILYFEPQGNSVEIHNIGMDEHGNLQNVPAGYRGFFLRETDTLLGFDGQDDG